MAYINAWVSYGDAAQYPTLRVVWQFDPPVWKPLPDPPNAVENRGFLKDDDGFDGSRVRERKVWPVGFYVTDVTLNETPNGLEVELSSTEIPDV